MSKVYLISDSREIEYHVFMSSFDGNDGYTIQAGVFYSILDVRAWVKGIKPELVDDNVAITIVEEPVYHTTPCDNE